MKKEVATILCTLLSVVLIAQTEVKSSQLIVGKNLLTAKEITGKEYEFEDLIYYSKLDTVNNWITLQLRGIKGKYYDNIGSVLVFDLNTNKIKWSRKIDYTTQEIEQYANVLFITSAKKIERINTATGETMWNTNRRLLTTIPNLNISLGTKYDFFAAEYNKVDAINLSTGEILWSRKMDFNYGLNGVMSMNDTAIIFKAAGLHQMNLKTGKGWEYSAVTGAFDYGKTVAANIAGVALGLLTGTFIVSTGHDLVSQINSNVATDSLNFYFASKEYLAALNHNGKVLWKTKLPNETSRSSLLYEIDRLYLINYGEAEYNGETANYGKPYFAAYDRKTGNQIFMNIRNENKNPIVEYLLSKDSVELYFSKGAGKYSLTDGSSTKYISFDEKKTGSLRYTISPNSIYLKTDSIYKSLFELNPESLFFMTTKNNVVQLNRSLEIERTIGLDELYLKKTETAKCVYLYLNDSVYIVDQNHLKIAEMNLGKNLIKSNSKLIEINKNYLTEIDLGKEFQ